MLGESNRNVEALLGKRLSSATTDATEWLREYLEAGPVAVDQVLSNGSKAGHAKRTLERAKTALGVKAERKGGVGGQGHWIWTLPTR